MKGMVKVEGHPHLMKNPVTGVLVNVDVNGYEAAKKRAEYTKSLETENNDLRDRVSTLERLISEVIENGKN